MTSNWSNTELILALDLYLRLPRCSRTDPNLTALAHRINRSAGSVYARLQNFKAVDPDYPGAGLTAGVSICQPVWEAFAKRLRDGESVDSLIESTAKQHQAPWLDRVRTLIIDGLNKEFFTLDDLYKFQNILELEYPNNKNIKDKLRQQLQVLRKLGEVEFLDGDGNYKLCTFLRVHLYPEEAEITELKFEGATYQIQVNAYERSPMARKECLAHHGYKCQACEMSFLERYGNLGDNFIHVHHLKPLSSIKEEYVVDPIHDLVPVCPNCHAMLHRRNPPLSIKELQAELK